MVSSNSQESEMDLRDLAASLWKGKWLIICITSIFSVASVFYALSVPNEYQSTVLLAPASSSNGSGLSSLAAQYGGLASLAGIKLGGASGGEDKVAIALSLITTWGFLEGVIAENDMAVPLFAVEGWDRINDKLLINPNIYDEANNTWVREFDPAKGQTAEPSSWELYKQFSERVSFSQDKASGLVSLTVEYYSPKLAKQWVESLVKSINTNLKTRDRNEAIKSIAYLQEKIKETQVSDMQTVFYQLIEEQTKTLMLAEVSDEYVFKTISPARVAEEKSKPKRALICVLGFILGGMLSVVIVLIRCYFFQGSK